MEDTRSVSEADKHAFVSFYNEHGVIPVSQDIGHPDFLFRRESLYKLLGVPIPSLRDRDILEFGPGGGYNATALAPASPRSMVFVDASVQSLQEIRAKQVRGLFGGANVEIIESNIFDFRSEALFDLVIIEGTVPGQTKPREMLSHAASFVAKDGYLITTTTSASSVLSEVCRKLIRPLIVEKNHTFAAQVQAAEKVFKSHLKNLGTQTRPAKDWVTDVIIHKFEEDAKLVFSLLDAASVTSDGFEFFGSSPKFLIDDRFYKKIGQSAKRSNELLAEQYSSIGYALLDYRVSVIQSMKEPITLDLEDLCANLYALQAEIVGSGSYSNLPDFIGGLRELRSCLPRASESTKASIDEFIGVFPRAVKRNEVPQFEEFAKWWGRGQQYASFLRFQ
jgi:2-polyprenyl-3-methyl-5-hydroxy-6-metoxy-1,4-benzoquinol methylase